MSSDVVSTYWSHNMDLLVIVTVDNLLELHRINYKAQKVFQIEEKKPITAVCFSPDCTFDNKFSTIYRIWYGRWPDNSSKDIKWLVSALCE